MPACWFDLLFPVILAFSELEFDTILVDLLVLAGVFPLAALGTILIFFEVALVRGRAGALHL